MGYRVVDVAGTWQGQVDWQAVEAELARRHPGDTMPAGIAKLSEGLHFVDPQGARNISELRRLGKKAIGYHCVTWHQDPVLQARLFAALLAQYGADAAMYDWETFDSPGGKRSATAQQVTAFHLELRRIWNRGPSLLYTAAWVFGAIVAASGVPAEGVPTPELLALPLVLGNPNPNNLDRWWPQGPVLHQLQETGYPGVKSTALDVSSGGTAFATLFNLNHTEEPPVAHTVNLTNGDQFIRGDNRRRNGYENDPALAAKIAAGDAVTQAEIEAVDPYAMHYIAGELAAYDRAIAGTAAAVVDVDEAALARDLRAELARNPLVINLTGKTA